MCACAAPVIGPETCQPYEHSEGDHLVYCSLCARAVWVLKLFEMVGDVCFQGRTTYFRGRTEQIWKTIQGNGSKNKLFIINGIRHVISDEMPVNMGT